MKADIMKRLICAGLLLIFLGSCSAQPQPETINAIDQFARATRILTKLVHLHFETAERVHQQAIRENLDLQFELGGIPDIKTPPLFTFEQRSARQILVGTLAQYANRLQRAYGTQKASNVNYGSLLNSVLVGTVDPSGFNVSPSMGKKDTQLLVSSLNGFASLLYAPKRDQKLGEILQKSNPMIEKAALLLFLDVGSPVDQDDSCVNQPSVQIVGGRVLSLKLCKGGLRALMDTAFKHRTRTLKRRLQLLSAEDFAPGKTREQIIDQLYALEKARYAQDAALQATQNSLFQMVAAHDELKTLFHKSPNPSEVSLFSNISLPQALSRFVEKMDHLPELIQNADQILDSNFVTEP
jgi:hypothetical protein